MTSRNRNFAVVTFPICAAIILAGAWFAGAGDLNPPVGAVGPTQRTPVNANMTPGDADSLFKISQPGSYYFTGNITGVVGKHGVEIVASGVTLDLNGFDLAGVPAMGFFDGVSVTLAGLRNIAVVNGSVRNWGDEGVDLGSSVAINSRVHDVLASGNAGNGILAGIDSTVSNCSASSNTVNGIITSAGGTVSNCAAYFNTAHGISTGNGSTVSNCSAFQNTGHGISTGNGGTVTNCSTHLNTANGITTGDGGTVSTCSAYQNTGSGISAGAGCTVADCTARGNTLDGILCTSGCVIRGNTCSLNGQGAGDGAGLHVTGVDNHIDGNSCTGANRGIDVDVAGNIIIKNTCSGNPTNWDVVAGNVCLVVLGVAGPAILGNSGGVAPGSTDPNANFSY